MKNHLSLAFLTPLLLAFTLSAQQQSSQPAAPAPHDMNMPGMNMPSSDAGEMSNPADENATHAMRSMEGPMDMGPHMKMTVLRSPKPGDQARADQVVEAARKVAGHYADYRTALQDGFRIFLPDVPQKMYHFTNYEYAFEAAFTFNPEHPTSLLYEKHGGGYKLIGVMYTAPKYFSESMLDERIPLSIAQWHAHVNLCLPPRGERQEVMRAHATFGLNGSISTKEACDAAGGTFLPQIFGWMVHVYPFEKNQANIWSVERQMAGHAE